MNDATNGPSLREYAETRFNLLTEQIKNMGSRFDEKMKESDVRYEQRFKAQMEAIFKSDVASEKRFESVNEFRKLVEGILREYIPRGEVDRQFEAITEKIKSTNDRIEGIEKRLNLGQGVAEGENASRTNSRSDTALWVSGLMMLISIAALIITLMRR